MMPNQVWTQEQVIKFVSEWVKQTPVADMATMFGKSKASITSFAVNLRKQGVRLPHRKIPGPKGLDVAKLNEMIGAK